MKKIGFLGGTFNPIHYGHLRIAIEVYEYCKLDSIDFVPVYEPTHKDSSQLLSFDTREHLLKLAFQHLSLDHIFSISKHESMMDLPSYSYYSLQEWQKIHSFKPYFIIGLEDFIKLDLWYKGLELINFTNFIVVNRSDLNVSDFQVSVEKFWGNTAVANTNTQYTIDSSTIEYIETTRLDISSTYIRNAFINNRSTACLLPQSVQDYIVRNSNIINIWK